MSYLQNQQGISDFKKAVISLWFRVPSDTVKKITDEYKLWLAEKDPEVPVQNRPRRFLGIVPLLTFGPTDLKAHEFWHQPVVVGTYPQLVSHVWAEDYPTCTNLGFHDIPVEDTGGPNIEFQPSFERGNSTFDPEGGFVLDGSYIGIDCTGNYPALSVNIVMPENAKAKMTGADSRIETFSQDEAWQVRGAGLCSGAPQLDINGCYTETYVSSTQHWTNKGYADVIAGCVPETFRLLGALYAGAANADSAPDYDGIEVKPDQWHHLLISLDVDNAEVVSVGQHYHTTINGGFSSSTPVEIGTEKTRMKSGCKIYLSFDDKNKVGRDLSVYAIGDNDVGTVHSHYVASALTNDIDESNNPSAVCGGINFTSTTISERASYKFSTEKIKGNNIGLPAFSAYVEAVRHVEMAELQLFTGVTLDTAIETNRRAFIDYERDENGNVTKDKDGNFTLLPVSMDKAEELLKKKPEIKLHGSSNWIDGENTGTTGMDYNRNPPKIKPDGQFQRVAVIKAYLPDPSLTKSGSSTRRKAGSVRLTKRPAADARL